MSSRQDQYRGICCYLLAILFAEEGVSSVAKSCILADRPSFVPSLVVIGGDEPISGRSGFSSNGWQTNTETARSGGC